MGNSGKTRTMGTVINRSLTRLRQNWLVPFYRPLFDHLLCDSVSNYNILSASPLLQFQNVLEDSRAIEHTHPIEVVGHRGSLYTALENTSRSFLHAAEAGADSVELDVFLLKCGTLVVFHGSGGDETPGLLHLYCGIDGSM